MTIPPLLALQGLPLLQTAAEGTLHTLSQGFAPLLKSAMQANSTGQTNRTKEPAAFSVIRQQLVGLLDQLGYGDTLPLSIQLESGEAMRITRADGSDVPFAPLLQSHPQFRQLIGNARRTLPANATGILHLRRESLTFQP